MNHWSVPDPKLVAAVNPTVAYVTEKLGAGLTALAEALKVPASQVWSILVTQAGIEGRLCLGVCGLILCLWAGMAWAVPKLARYEKETDNITSAPGTIIGTALVGVITAIIFGNCLWNGVLMTMNPEYYALQEIMQLF